MRRAPSTVVYTILLGLTASPFALDAATNRMLGPNFPALVDTHANGHPTPGTDVAITPRRNGGFVDTTNPWSSCTGSNPSITLTNLQGGVYTGIKHQRPFGYTAINASQFNGQGQPTGFNVTYSRQLTATTQLVQTGTATMVDTNGDGVPDTVHGVPTSSNATLTVDLPLVTSDIDGDGKPDYVSVPFASLSALGMKTFPAGCVPSGAGASDPQIWIPLSANGNIVPDLDGNGVADSDLPSGPVLAPGTVSASCTPNDTTLCVNSRFQVQVGWSTVQGGGQSGQGHAVSTAPIGFTSGGIFWFFDSTNPEMLVKVVNACAISPPRYWVFASAGTNVGLNITVTDKSNGQVKTYTNPDLQAAQPIQDTNAFATCP